MSSASARTPEKALLSPSRKQSARKAKAAAEAPVSPIKGQDANNKLRRQLQDCLQKFAVNEEPKRPSAAPHQPAVSATAAPEAPAAPRLSSNRGTGYGGPGLSLPEQLARLSVDNAAPQASVSRVEVPPAAQTHLARERTAGAPSREEALTMALAAAHEQAARATARAVAAEAEAARADASRAAMAGTVDALSRHNSRLAAELDALMAELTVAKASNASLQASLDAAEGELCRLKDEFEESMKRSVAAAVAAAAPTPMPQRRRRDADAARARGNQCFKEKRWDEAAAEYSAGLAAAASLADMETVRAVLHSNRAAVLHAQGRFLDAASDCSAALALDPNFTKARVRRADMLASMGDYDACVKDLEELLAAADGSDEADLAGWRAKLADARAKLRVQGGVADHYAVLGLAPDASVAAVKAAFRSLALKHHPDKAPPELGAPLKCAQEQLFKLLSNAHATLTDVAKRQRFDMHREAVAKKMSTAGVA